MLSEARVTLWDLQNLYGTEDAYNMLEVLLVNAYNRRIVNKPRRS